MEEVITDNPEGILADYGEALVVRGAGGPISDWVQGLTNMLINDGITTKTEPDQIWKGVFVRKVDERTDLILPFTNLDMSKLPIWRIKNHSLGLAWLSDYIHFEE